MGMGLGLGLGVGVVTKPCGVAPTPTLLEQHGTASPIVTVTRLLLDICGLGRIWVQGLELRQSAELAVAVAYRHGLRQ